jgi:hypothetical protein
MNRKPESATKNAERKRRHYTENREAILERNKKYKLDNPDKVEEWRANEPPEQRLLNGARRRAKERNQFCDITIDDIKIPEYCPVLGIKLERGKGTILRGSPTLDCFKPERGYVPGNVFVISYKANTMKNDATIEDVEKLLVWMRSKN